MRFRIATNLAARKLRLTTFEGHAFLYVVNQSDEPSLEPVGLPVWNGNAPDNSARLSDAAYATALDYAKENRWL